MVDIETVEFHVGTRTPLSHEQVTVLNGQLQIFERVFTSDVSSLGRRRMVDYFKTLVTSIREGMLPNEILEWMATKSKAEPMFAFLYLPEKELGMSGWEYLEKVAKGEYKSPHKVSPQTRA